MFTVTGYADPEAYERLAACPFVSPGLVAQAVEEVPLPRGQSGLFITRADVVEISATMTPVGAGTSFTIEPPTVVPVAERFALEPPGVFRISAPTTFVVE